MSGGSKRSPAFLALARPYVRRALAAAMDGVHVHGLSALAAQSAREPLVLAVNHVAHWDPLVLVALEERLPGAGHALMDAENLARLPFFANVGAVPLTRTDHDRALDDLDAASDLVRGAAERMWIFPQGRQRAPHLRPLALRPGILRLLAKSGASLVCVGLAYAYREAETPACAVSIGPPIDAARASAEGLEGIERAMVAELSRIDAWLTDGAITGAMGFEVLIGPRTNRIDDAWHARLLGKLSGAFR